MGSDDEKQIYSLFPVIHSYVPFFVRYFSYGPMSPFARCRFPVCAYCRQGLARNKGKTEFPYGPFASVLQSVRGDVISSHKIAHVKTTKSPSGDDRSTAIIDNRPFGPSMHRLKTSSFQTSINGRYATRVPCFVRGLAKRNAGTSVRRVRIENPNNLLSSRSAGRRDDARRPNRTKSFPRADGVGGRPVKIPLGLTAR